MGCHDKFQFCSIYSFLAYMNLLCNILWLSSLNCFRRNDSNEIWFFIHNINYIPLRWEWIALSIYEICKMFSWSKIYHGKHAFVHARLLILEMSRFGLKDFKDIYSSVNLNIFFVHINLYTFKWLWENIKISHKNLRKFHNGLPVAKHERFFSSKCTKQNKTLQ